jgi:hypothetical protein
MTRVGGRVFSAWTANNLCGHGFFQFSPEFAFRVFAEAHGFEAERVALVESRFPSVELTSRWLVLDVVDPDRLGQRALRMSARPALLMVKARKLRHLDDPFAKPLGRAITRPAGIPIGRLERRRACSSRQLRGYHRTSDVCSLEFAISGARLGSTRASTRARRDAFHCATRVATAHQ